MALYNESPDFGAVSGINGGVVLVGDNTLGISLAGHEILHTLGEPHSRLASETAPRMYSFMSIKDFEINSKEKFGSKGIW